MVRAPSKRIQIMLSVAIVATGGILAYKLLGNKLFVKAQQANLVAVSPGLSSQSDVDSDGDGLKDWQEALWGTDPHNPDTDGDGTPDGQEVAEGRDPLVAGPNDLLANTRPGMSTSTADNASSSDPLGANGNNTDQLARQLFSNFMAQGVNNLGSMSSDTEQSMVNQSLSNLQEPQLPASYSVSDLTIFNPTSAEEVRDYGNSLAEALDGGLQSYSTANPYTVKFGDLIKAYNAAAIAVVGVKVPSDAANIQLTFANNFDQMYQAAQLLDKYNESDPIKALMAVQMMQTLETSQQQAKDNLATYFKANNIIFNNSEPGYEWTVDSNNVNDATATST